MYKKFLKSPSPCNESSYKRYKNKLNHYLRLAKPSYYEVKLKTLKNNIKRTWNILNQIINCTKHPNKLPSTFADSNNQDISDPCLIANQFCNFFTNLGPSLAKKIPTSVNTYRCFLRERSFSSFFFESATQCEIVEIAKSLRINTAAGHDKVPMWSVKESINYISEPLTYIINLSINSGVVPDQMKLARVVPLFKSGDKRLFSNFWPVSVLPIFSKFLEKIAYFCLINCLDKRKLLASNQYGFRKNHSTSLALLYLYDKITAAVDERKYMAGLFLDLSKAFDTVFYLVNLIEHYGIRGLALEWVKSYLCKRLQYVEFNGVSSSYKEILCGVPQGSVLVPYSFY